MNRTFAIIASIVSLCGLFPLTVASQPPVLPEDDAKIRNYIAWKLVDYLQLTEDQSTRLFPLWRDYSDTRGNIQQERRQLFRKIEISAEDSAISTDNLLGLLKEYRNAEDNETKLKDTFFKNARKVLDDRQYVKLYTFDERLLDELMRGMNNRRGAGQPANNHP
jgi:hypothetical protein